MKKNYKKQLFQLAILLLSFQAANAQVEFRYLSGFGTALYDINDSGYAIQGGAVYSFLLNSSTPMDTQATSLVGINNNGDLIGTMPLLVSATTINQPAYKKNGTWYPMGYFPGVTADASAYQGQISENGNYITGQMSIDCCNSQAYLYNVDTGVLEEIYDPANEYSAGYCVNDSGILGGWYDPQPSGTLRVPAYMRTGSVITSVPSTLPVLSSTNQISAINNSNIMVGDRDGVPFIYDLATNTFTTFQVPTGYENATFTSVSDNGVAVGYAQNTFPNIVRDAIVYHPSLGSQPVLLRTVLAAHGIDTVSTFDGLLGTAIAISPDGNFICGWENAFVAFASGWIINFSDSLISDCYATCPQDIVDVSLTGATVVNYPDPIISCGSHPAATIVLASGLASGSVFPIGTTLVVHNLVDTNGTILNSCSFNVVLTDSYCDPSSVNNTGEPITLVNVADINNASSESSIADYEDFTSVIGNVEIDSSYTTTFKGLTNGNYDNYFSVYVDWNQDGFFNDNDERYEMGYITNSSGIDTIQTTGTLSVPSNALVGQTTMRVIKNYFEYSVSPCFISSGYGQVEDYKLNVTSNPTGIDQINSTNIRLYPNPVSGILNISNTEKIKSVSIYDILGQKMIVENLNGLNSQIDLSKLSNGIYFVKVIVENKTNTFTINKQ